MDATRRFTLLRAGVIAALLAAAGPAAAAPDAAEALFNDGFAHMKAGRLEQACPAIEASYRLDPRPGTLFTLAECEGRRGRIATAMRHYRAYLAFYEAFPPERKAQQRERARISRAEIEAHRREVPKLTIRLPEGAPAGTRVTRDGDRITEAMLGLALPLDPGEHVLRAEAPGGKVVEERVQIEKGEAKEIVLDPLKAADKPVAPPRSIGLSATTKDPSPDGGVSGRRAAAWAAGGAGLVGLLIGGIAGGLAIAKKGVVDENCDGPRCNQAGFEAANSMDTLGTVSTIGIGVGAAGAGAGLVLFLTEPEAPKVGARASEAARGGARSGVTLTLRGAF